SRVSTPCATVARVARHPPPLVCPQAASNADPAASTARTRLAVVTTPMKVDPTNCNCYGQVSMRYGADRPQRQPKHQQLKEALVRLMEGLPMDAPLPAERELSEAHGISRQTVRQALHQLVAEGRIYRRQGSGTYVASHKAMHAVDLDDRADGGTDAETAGSVRLVGVDRRRPDPQEAAALGLAEGTEVLQIERLRIADGEGVGVERVTVDAARFDGLWASAADADALPRFFWDSHGLEVAEAEQTIEAVPASAREAGLLGVAGGIPLLLVRRRPPDSGGRPRR